MHDALFVWWVLRTIHHPIRRSHYSLPAVTADKLCTPFIVCKAFLTSPYHALNHRNMSQVNHKPNLRDGTQKQKRGHLLLLRHSKVGSDQRLQLQLVSHSAQCSSTTRGGMGRWWRRSNCRLWFWCTDANPSAATQHSPRPTNCQCERSSPAKRSAETGDGDDRRRACPGRGG